MKPAQKVDLNKILASNTLSLPPDQQIINKDLTKPPREPHWYPENSVRNKRR